MRSFWRALAFDIARRQDGLPATGSPGALGEGNTHPEWICQRTWPRKNQAARRSVLFFTPHRRLAAPRAPDETPEGRARRPERTASCDRWPSRYQGQHHVLDYRYCLPRALCLFRASAESHDTTHIINRRRRDMGPRLGPAGDLRFLFFTPCTQHRH